MSEDQERRFSLVGETLGIWRLLRGIGRGGMGEVYEAEYDYLPLLLARNRMLSSEQHRQLRAELNRLPREDQAAMASEVLGSSLPPARRFAIKVSTARVNTSGHHRFLQEAELAKRLGAHPHIVTVEAIHTPRGDAIGGDLAGLGLAMTRHNDVAFMVMELAHADYDFRRLTVPQAAYIVRCIATALDHAHAQHIVHRDIKPENILGPIEHPSLTDFGIAKELDKRKSEGFTVTGQIIGTIDYMSPEQASDAKNVDHRSDIYSLGVVLYEYTTGGQLPYAHIAQREAALTAIQSERHEPRWPRDYVPRFPRGLERIILKAIAHRPSERYQVMSEFIRDLDTYAAGRWIPWMGRVHPMRYVRHQVQRHPRLAWAIPTAVVLLLLMWLAIQLPHWFDQTRRSLDHELTVYEELIEQVALGQRQQLNRRERDRFVNQLGKRVDELREAYPALAVRYDEAQEQRVARRWLRANFTADDKLAAKEQLEAALLSAPASWGMTEHGLRCTQQAVLRLGPYGRGLIYINVLIDLPAADGVDLIVEEHGHTIERHKTGIRLDSGQLLVIHVVDRRPPLELHRQAMPSPLTFDAALQVSERDIRADIDGVRLRKPVGALRRGHPAEVTLVLPAGSVLRYLEIQPERMLSSQ